MPDYTKKTLGVLLSSDNETIRRNATSILKQLQRKGMTDEERKWQRLNDIERQIEEHILDYSLRHASLRDHGEQFLDEGELAEYDALYKELIEEA